MTDDPSSTENWKGERTKPREAPPGADPHEAPGADPRLAPTVAPVSSLSTSGGKTSRSVNLPVPSDFGKYKLLQVLGQGGMGAVYMAEDPTLERKVALKIPLVDPTERSAVLDRFQREAKAVAPLQHPGICPVFEVGEVDGRPYMTMAFIKGKPLSAFIDPAKPLAVKSALSMAVKIAAALDYAHKNGVIHRDLKPANVMVNERREPVVMDFGLARRSCKPDETRLTQAGSVMGTPAYMPPEQAKGDPTKMGPACDIYSLGVIVFEMLTGRVPFEGDLFSVMMQLASEAPPALPSLRADLDPALDALVQKALAKNAADRFASMADFGRAMSAYLRGQTTSAGSPSAEQMTPVLNESGQSSLSGSDSKVPSYVRQLPPSSVPGTTAAANSQESSPKRGIGIVVWGAVAVALVAIGGGGYFLFAPASPVATKTTTPNAPSDAQPETAKSLGKETKEPTATVASPWPIGPADNVLPGLISRPAKLPGIARWQIYSRWPSGVLGSYPGSIMGMQWSPDNRFIAYAGGDGTIRILDGQSKQLVCLLIGHQGRANTVAWSPDSQLLASASSVDFTVRVWNVADGRQLHVASSGHVPMHISWSHDGKYLAGGCRSKESRLPIWSVGNTELTDVGRDCPFPANSAAWLSDGRIVTTSRDLRVRIYDRQTSRFGQEFPAVNSLAITLSANDRWLALGEMVSPYKIQLYQLDGTPGPATNSNGPPVSLAFHPDKPLLAIAAFNGTRQIWDFSSNQKIADIKAVEHDSGGQVSWSPDGTQLAMVNLIGSFGIWRPADGKLESVAADRNLEVQTVAWRPSQANLLATADSRGAVRLWTDAAPRLVVPANPNGIRDFSWHPQEFRFATAGKLDKCIQIWDAQSGRALAKSKSHSNLVNVASWSHDGKTIAFGGDAGKTNVSMVDAQTADITRDWNIPSSVYRVDWSYVSPHLAATAGGGPNVRILNTADNSESLVDVGANSRDVAWHPRQDIFAAALEGNNVVKVCDAASKQTLAVLSVESLLKRSPGLLICVRWSPDGRRLAVGHSSGWLYIWDYETKSIRHSILAHCSALQTLSWSPDGRQLVTGGEDAAVRWWNPDTGLPERVALFHSNGSCALFTGAGEPLHLDESLKPELFYLVEDSTGARQHLSFADFQKRIQAGQ